MTVDQATAQALKEYPVHFTVGHAIVSGNPRTGFGTFIIRAVSASDAARVATHYLGGVDTALECGMILREEIRLETGWHYLDSRGIDAEARSEPGLQCQKDDRLYDLGMVVQGPTRK